MGKPLLLPFYPPKLPYIVPQTDVTAGATRSRQPGKYVKFIPRKTNPGYATDACFDKKIKINKIIIINNKHLWHSEQASVRDMCVCWALICRNARKSHNALCYAMVDIVHGGLECRSVQPFLQGSLRDRPTDTTLLGL